MNYIKAVLNDGFFRESNKGAFLVAIAIANAMHAQSGPAEILKKDLAASSRMTERGVQKSVGQLVAAQKLRVEYEVGEHRENRYSLTYSK